ncbi:hypothetical protein FHL15_000692 [Xylaria flabelliformis]|uniref:Uncharacterized protein n=1 Tax=Xylaria flabelliformis TaxID=2512241 RepID=A0A553IEI0_9PEZI|nr:hypothetical protein FHL15_000692 [Xylaria flabelliformis]
MDTDDPSMYAFRLMVTMETGDPTIISKAMRPGSGIPRGDRRNSSNYYDDYDLGKAFIMALIFGYEQLA